MEVVLEMNDGITWTIDGSTINSENLEDINLEVTVGSGHIPKDELETLIGNETFIELSLSHDGEFGFNAVLTVDLPDAQPGEYANLFYYNEETGEFEFMCATLISSTSKASFEFKHASEYVIIISEDTKETLIAERTEELKRAEALQDTEEQPAIEVMADLPEERPTENPLKAAGVIALILLGSVAIVIALYLIFRKQDKD